MATQITNYQCPSCTGPLQFSATTGKLECEYCGSGYSVEEIEALYIRAMLVVRLVFRFSALKETSEDMALLVVPSNINS